ncbi:MAG TPA: CBS domain-containing protein, partial [Actinomycetota bacterium]|nr:CBS domain-containing protein [Actinomycetota bacterium]
MQVADIMKANVKSASPGDSFANVARLLHDNAISSVVVMDGDRLAGIVTERDLVNLVAEGLDPRTTKVGDRMSTNLDTVEPRSDIAEAAEHMARLRIRHLPVVDKGKLVGIISIRDLTNWAVEEI